MGTLRRVFAATVYELRVARGLSPNRLGELAGIDHSAITRIENGVRPVRLIHLEKILLALNVPLTRLPAILERVIKAEMTPDELREEIGRTATKKTIDEGEIQNAKR